MKSHYSDVIISVTGNRSQWASNAEKCFRMMTSSWMYSWEGFLQQSNFHAIQFQYQLHSFVIHFQVIRWQSMYVFAHAATALMLWHVNVLQRSLCYHLCESVKQHYGYVKWLSWRLELPVNRVKSLDIEVKISHLQFQLDFPGSKVLTSGLHFFPEKVTQDTDFCAIPQGRNVVNVGDSQVEVYTDWYPALYLLSGATWSRSRPMREDVTMQWH